MRNTQAVKQHALACVLAIGSSLGAEPLGAQQAAAHTSATTQNLSAASNDSFAAETLSAQQQAILPIAAFAAAGEIEPLKAALIQGLDAGMSISDIREILVQLYAYAGFPRSLNALNAFMQVLESRQLRGIEDAPGREPIRPIPQGDALRAAGTANQTQLVGRPVTGAVQDFAPAIAEYLQTHLFGAIFERDNLDWQSRELATVAMLSALPGAEAQLQGHLRYSMHVGLTAQQMQHVVEVLQQRVGPANGQRAQAALAQVLAVPSP